SGPPSPAGETKDRRWRSPRSAPPVVLVSVLWLLPCLWFSFNQGLIYRKFSIHAAAPLPQPDGISFAAHRLNQRARFPSQLPPQIGHVHVHHIRARLRRLPHLFEQGRARNCPSAIEQQMFEQGEFLAGK